MSLSKEQKAQAERLFSKIERTVRREVRAFDKSDDASDSSARERREAIETEVMADEGLTNALGRVVRAAIREAA